VIVDVEATPARWTAEVASTRLMIDRTKSRLDLQPEKLAADTAYGSGFMLAWLTERGIEPHIPVIDRTGQTNGMFTHRDFTFDRDRNAYVCPGGKDLPFTHRRHDIGILVYRAHPRDCSGCSLKPHCTAGVARVLSVNPHEAIRQHVAGLARTPDFEKSARLRRKVEMCFAHLKRKFGDDQLHMRDQRLVASVPRAFLGKFAAGDGQFIFTLDQPGLRCGQGRFKRMGLKVIRCRGVHYEIESQRMTFDSRKINTDQKSNYPARSISRPTRDGMYKRDCASRCRKACNSTAPPRSIPPRPRRVAR
jgi:hypothetical protein